MVNVASAISNYLYPANMDKYLADSYGHAIFALTGEMFSSGNYQTLEKALLELNPKNINLSSTYNPKTKILHPAIITKDKYYNKIEYHLFLQNGRIRDHIHSYLIIYTEKYIEVYYYSSYRVENELPVRIKFEKMGKKLKLLNATINISEFDPIAPCKESEYIQNTNEMFNFNNWFYVDETGTYMR